jgi:hypothetical protein
MYERFGYPSGLDEDEKMKAEKDKLNKIASEIVTKIMPDIEKATDNQESKVYLMNEIAMVIQRRIELF